MYLLHRGGKYRRQVFNNELSCEITWNVALILSERSRISATFKSEASRILQCVFVCGTPYMRSHIVPSNVPTSVCEMRLVPASYVKFFRYTSEPFHLVFTLYVLGFRPCCINVGHINKQTVSGTKNDCHDDKTVQLRKGTRIR